MIYLLANCPRSSKIALKLRRPIGFSVRDQTFKMLFRSIRQEPLGLLIDLNATCEFLKQFNKDAYTIFQKGVDNFEIEHKTC